VRWCHSPTADKQTGAAHPITRNKLKQQTNKQTERTNTMTTIEQLIETIKSLHSIAEQALDLVDDYSGGESETADELRDYLDGVMKAHHAND
jgi:hypothetical protein